MSVVVDPTNDNVAILPDGALGYAVRAVPQSADPSRPTVAQLTGGTIIGYSEGLTYFDEDKGKAGRVKDWWEEQ
jgi:hypothetical protein